MSSLGGPSPPPAAVPQEAAPLGGERVSEAPPPRLGGAARKVGGGGAAGAAMEPRGAEYFCAQVLQKDVSGRLQAGEELLLYLGAPGAIPDLEDDPSRLAKTVDALTGWVGSSNYRVSGGANGLAAGAGGRARYLPRLFNPAAGVRTRAGIAPRFRLHAAVP